MSEDRKELSEEQLKKMLDELKAFKLALEVGDDSPFEKLRGFGNSPETVIENIARAIERLEPQMKTNLERVHKAERMLEILDRYSLNPDFSDIRLLGRMEVYDTGIGYDQTMARWVKDHTEIYNWRGAPISFYHTCYVLIHETLHGLIGKILIEDELGEAEDSHYPFHAGLDTFMGVCHSDLNPEDIKIRIEEAAAFGFKSNARKLFEE